MRNETFVVSTGQALIDEDHYASDAVRARMSDLRTKWDALHASCDLKGQRLRQAYSAVQLFRRCDELKVWMDRVEDDLSHAEHGKDLSSALVLLKRCDALGEEIAAHDQRVQEVAAQETAMLGECARWRCLVLSGVYD